MTYYKIDFLFYRKSILPRFRKTPPSSVSSQRWSTVRSTRCSAKNVRWKIRRKSFCPGKLLLYKSQTIELWHDMVNPVQPSLQSSKHFFVTFQPKAVSFARATPYDFRPAKPNWQPPEETWRSHWGMRTTTKLYRPRGFRISWWVAPAFSHLVIF